MLIHDIPAIIAFCSMFTPLDARRHHRHRHARRHRRQAQPAGVDEGRRRAGGGDLRHRHAAQHGSRTRSIGAHLPSVVRLVIRTRAGAPSWRDVFPCGDGHRCALTRGRLLTGECAAPLLTVRSGMTRSERHRERTHHAVHGGHAAAAISLKGIERKHWRSLRAEQKRRPKAALIALIAVDRDASQLTARAESPCRPCPCPARGTGRCSCSSAESDTV